MNLTLPHRFRKPLALGGGIIVIGALGYSAYLNRNLSRENDLIKGEKKTVEEELYAAQGQIESLEQIVRDREYTIETFGSTISNLSNTVGDLHKLSQTDSELLMKYSRIYFLNENYVPSKLENIDERFLFNKTNDLLIHANVWPYLRDLLNAAEDENKDLLVASAFRSFDTQAALKSGYKVLYGSGANQFSADQGYSEHQLGTTVDFTTPAVGAVFSAFETDPSYQWLMDNAYKYGFVLSYPKGNVYYKFEPWHWRFVGVELATELHNKNKYFYDLDQREIDEYLIKIFD